MAEKIPSWPKVTIRLYDDHNAEVKIAGRSHPVNHHDPRQAAIALVSERAGQLGRPVKATAVESDGASWTLIIHPDGQVESVEPDTGRGRGKGGGNSKPIWPIVVAAALACVLIAGTALYLGVFRGRGGTPQATASPKLPALPEPVVGPDQFVARPVPPGWSTKAGWTVDIAPNTVPAVSPDGTQVAALTPDHKLVVFDSNGKVLWQDKVPERSSSPVYTLIDSKPVVAVTTEASLYYWPGDGALPTEVELPNQADVQFFGTSPLVQLGQEAGASVVTGADLKTVPNQPRSSTILLAEGNRALIARYGGQLYWSEPDKNLVELELKAPVGSKGGIDHVVAASPGFALVLWKTATTGMVIPTVHSTANGAVAATCKPTRGETASNWQWVPDTSRKVAAWGECLIDFTTRTTVLSADFRPLSITAGTIYGTRNNDPVSTRPGKPVYPLAKNTARPWGIVGGHAIVVHNSVLFALDKK